MNVWQDTRTDRICARLGDLGAGAGRYRDRVGPPIATYVAAPKARWILDQVDRARQRAERGVLFGTVDSWLLWNLAGPSTTTAVRTSCARSPGCSRRTGVRTRAASSRGSPATSRRGISPGAALEATPFQTREVVDAVTVDSGVELGELKVDGGMVGNELLMQRARRTAPQLDRGPTVAPTDGRRDPSS